MNVMDIAQKVETVEKELLEIIADHLIQNKIDVATARKMAQDFLSILPVSDQEDLLNKLKSLGEKYEEAQEVYVEELGKMTEETRNAALNKMRDAIKSGNIDNAITVAHNLKGTA